MLFCELSVRKESFLCLKNIFNFIIISWDLYDNIHRNYENLRLWFPWLHGFCTHSHHYWKERLNSFMHSFGFFRGFWSIILICTFYHISIDIMTGSVHKLDYELFNFPLPFLTFIICLIVIYFLLSRLTIFPQHWGSWEE